MTEPHGAFQSSPAPTLLPLCREWRSQKSSDRADDQRPPGRCNSAFTERLRRDYRSQTKKSGQPLYECKPPSAHPIKINQNGSAKWPNLATIWPICHPSDTER